MIHLLIDVVKIVFQIQTVLISVAWKLKSQVCVTADTYG